MEPEPGGVRPVLPSEVNGALAGAVVETYWPEERRWFRAVVVTAAEHAEVVNLGAGGARDTNVRFLGRLARRRLLRHGMGTRRLVRPAEVGPALDGQRVEVFESGRWSAPLEVARCSTLAVLLYQEQGDDEYSTEELDLAKACAEGHVRMRRDAAQAALSPITPSAAQEVSHAPPAPPSERAEQPPPDVAREAAPPSESAEQPPPAVAREAAPQPQEAAAEEEDNSVEEVGAEDWPPAVLEPDDAEPELELDLELELERGLEHLEAGPELEEAEPEDAELEAAEEEAEELQEGRPPGKEPDEPDREEGTPTRLLEEADLSAALVGATVELWWPEDDAWFRARVVSLHVKAMLVYEDDNNVELLGLLEEVRKGNVRWPSDAEAEAVRSRRAATATVGPSRRLLTPDDVTEDLVGRAVERLWPIDGLWYLAEVEAVRAGVKRRKTGSTRTYIRLGTRITLFYPLDGDKGERETLNYFDTVSVGALRWADDAAAAARGASSPSEARAVDEKASRSAPPSPSANATALNDEFCAVCNDGGDELLCCDGPCMRAFHTGCVAKPPADDADDWVCRDCELREHQCTACGERGRDGADVVKCSRARCGQYFHRACLNSVSCSMHGVGSVGDECPAHRCTRCHGSKGRLLVCFFCRVRAYHKECIPEGTVQWLEDEAVPSGSAILSCEPCQQRGRVRLDDLVGVEATHELEPRVRAPAPAERLGFTYLRSSMWWRTGRMLEPVAPPCVMEVFITAEGKGLGVRPMSAIAKGVRVGEYAGEIVTEQEANRRSRGQTAALRAYTFSVGKNCVDASHKGGWGRLLNHSCDANVHAVKATDRSPRVMLVAARDIAAREELTIDYSPGLSLQQGARGFIACLCGAAKCRSFVFAHGPGGGGPQ